MQFCEQSVSCGTIWRRDPVNAGCEKDIEVGKKRDGAKTKFPFMIVLLQRGNFFWSGKEGLRILTSGSLINVTQMKRAESSRTQDCQNEDGGAARKCSLPKPGVQNCTEK